MIKYLHDFALSNAGNGQWDTLCRFNTFAHRIQGHDLQWKTLHISDEPPVIEPSLMAYLIQTLESCKGNSMVLPRENTQIIPI